MNDPVAFQVSTSKAGPREWLGLAAIALPCMVYSMDLMVLDLALPAIGRGLKPTSAELLWIIDIYGFLLAGSLVTMGMLGDRFGRRRVLLIGAAGFIVASVLGALSTSPVMLIAARGLLGLAGATLAPSTLSLIRNLFLDPRERTFAIGIWATSFSTGAALGPLAGGLLLQHFWWGSAFLIGIPIMALLLAVGPFLLPESRAQQLSAIDWLSAALSALGVLPLIYGIKQVALGGSKEVGLACLIVGLVAGMVFVRRQRALQDPLLDLALFQNREFTASLVVYLLTVFATFVSLVFFAQFLQQVQGLSVFAAGLSTIPTAVGFIVGSQLAPQLVKRYSAANLIAASLSIAATGLLFLAKLGPNSSLVYAICGSVLLALGAAPAVTLITDLVVSRAPAERAGTASALSETCGEFGGALGIALLGTVGSALSRRRLASLGDLAPTGEPFDTIADALSAARTLPQPEAGLLTVHAREAFMVGMSAAMLIAALIVAACAVFVYRVLGGSRSASSTLTQRANPG
jgi:DHA2 family multidrug resistance protein-like MFS transporter